VRTNCSAVLLLLAGALLLSGCGHRSARVNVPPPPSIPESTPPASSPGAESNIPSPPPEGPVVPQPAFVETGVASWYGPPYHNRRASDGEIYNMNALTAAHRTLPLGSIVRVTNIKTHHSVVVRITDRGPFIPGRIIDLSLAAAKAVDVWRPGLATVRVELLKTPAALNQGGRWAVQIGASTTNKPPPSCATIWLAAITPPGFTNLPVPRVTGGCRCVCSRMTSVAPKR